MINFCVNVAKGSVQRTIYFHVRSWILAKICAIKHKRLLTSLESPLVKNVVVGRYFSELISTIMNDEERRVVEDCYGVT